MFRKKDFRPEPVRESFRQAVTDFISEHWHGTEMLLRGQIIDMTKAEGLVVFNEGDIIGLITYVINDSVCEITSFDSLVSGSGIGTMLMDSAIKKAKKEGCRRVQLITTNDNLTSHFLIPKVFRPDIQDIFCAGY